MPSRTGEYAVKGDYHRKLNKNWKYLPIYLAKMKFVEGFISKIDKTKRILDLGCGEGVLVEKFRKKGYNIVGMDLNYDSEHVIKGNIMDTKLNSSSFDVVLCLDVLEHLNFEEQELAIKEANRVIKPNGTFLLTLPNLAHFASRLSFLLTGNLIRTSKIDRHKGDRPINEYIKLINKYFSINKRKGIFPTFPISSLLTYMFPSKVSFLHKILNTLFAYPNWCFLNIFICRKK